MSSRRGFPQRNLVGRMYQTQEMVPGKDDTDHVIVWENVDGGPAAWQWVGYKSDAFKNKRFHFSAWIKFVDSVPPETWNFGLKVCGTFYNTFLKTCTANKWCRISECVYCDGNDNNFIILIFDTVARKGQIVKMHKITLSPGKIFNYKYV